MTVLRLPHRPPSIPPRPTGAIRAAVVPRAGDGRAATTLRTGDGRVTAAPRNGTVQVTGAPRTGNGRVTTAPRIGDGLVATAPTEGIHRDETARRTAGGVHPAGVIRHGAVGRGLERAGAVIAMARPWFWPVSLLPYAVGLVLATHRLVPAVEQWPRAALGAVVAGPLVWLAVLALNDAYDLPSDRRNPRKATAPLVRGVLSARTARRTALGAGAVAVLLALAVRPEFAAGTLLVLLLGAAYSVPPVRLKARPGADVAVNALTLGALGPLAGWTALHPLAGFPWPIAVQGTLVGVALYIPTTLADHRTDQASGDDTFAVRLGPRAGYAAGLAAWVLAAALSVLLAALDVVIPHRMLIFEVVTVPGLVVAYHLLLRRRRTITRVAVVSALFLAPSAIFALTYTGTL